MSSLAMKRVVATALAGAAIASAIGTTAASARPMGQWAPGAPGSVASASVPPPPSSLAAPAGSAYEELRAPDQPTGGSEPVADEPSAPSGFDVLSAAIGAATGAGIVIVLLATGGLIRRRPPTRSHGTARA